jgi:DNA-directed RNA polymerase
MPCMHQLSLFINLPAGLALHVRCRRAARRCISVGVQLILDLKVIQDLDDEDDPLITAPVIHRTIKASDAAPITIKGPRSVFDIGRAGVPMNQKRVPKAEKTITRIERLEGVTRSVRILEQETAEWRERDEQRRARQILPRPPKQSFKL